MKQINQQQLIEFLDTYKKCAGSVMKKSWVVSHLKPIGFKIDEKRNRLILGDKQVALRVDYGYKDEAGYAIGFVIEAIWSLLCDTKPKDMTCVFPSSMYYLIELRERTDRAVEMIKAVV